MDLGRSPIALFFCPGSGENLIKIGIKSCTLGQVAYWSAVSWTSSTWEWDDMH